MKKDIEEHLSLWSLDSLSDAFSLSDAEFYKWLKNGTKLLEHNPIEKKELKAFIIEVRKVIALKIKLSQQENPQIKKALRGDSVFFNKPGFFSLSAINKLSFQKLENTFHEFALHQSDFYGLTNEKFIVHISSSGGFISVADKIVKFIDEYPQSIHLVGENLFSAGLRVFLLANCSKELSPYANGLFHLSRSQIEVGPDGFIYPTESIEQSIAYSLVALSDIKALMDQYGFSDSEKERVLNKEDVYFDYDRLSQILEHIEVSHYPFR